MNRLSDSYFDDLYARSGDPWSLGERWYEQRKYAITLALLPRPRYRHAFEPGCSVGVLTARLAQRCDRITSTDVSDSALSSTAQRVSPDRVQLVKQSIDEPWPAECFDLVVLSEVGYYLAPETLRRVLDAEVPRLRSATVVAAHWRHPVADYPMSGDQVHEMLGATTGLHRIGGYLDADVVIDVFDTDSDMSVAARTEVPGA